MHDEYSALFRTQFDSLGELFRQGIMPDGHPALIQLFLFIWTRLVGFNPFLVKLPFLIAGVYGIYIAYIFTKENYNETAALLVAVFFATAEPFVLYSQIARPYIFGLLFSLLAVLQWSRILFNTESTNNKTYILYIVYSVLASYTHYFSLFFIALIGLFGIIFTKKENIKKYILANIVTVVLFLPHLSISLFQFKIGGLSWLSVPDNNFIFRYLFYNFHYSFIFLFVTVLILLLFFKKPDSKTLKLFTFFVQIFLITFFTAFFYSIYRKPILQYSVLFFSMSMLIISLFGFVKKQKVWKNAVMVALIALVSISTLTLKRKYFYLMYNSIYKKIVEGNQKYNSVNNSVIAYSNKKINSYLMNKYKLDSNYFEADFDSLPKLDSFLKENLKKIDTIFFGQTTDCNPVVFNLIANYYPHIEKQNNYFLGQTYLLTKDKESRIEIMNINFDTTITKSLSFKKENITDSVYLSFPNSYKCNRELYLLRFDDYHIGNWQIKPYDYIDISAKIFTTETQNDILMVAELIQNDSTIKWNGININSFTPKAQQWNSIYNSIMIPAFTTKELRNTKLKVYIWNKSKSIFFVDDYSIKIRKGNQYIYGIYEKIEY